MTPIGTLGELLAYLADNGATIPEATIQKTLSWLDMTLDDNIYTEETDNA